MWHLFSCIKELKRGHVKYVYFEVCECEERQNYVRKLNQQLLKCGVCSVRMLRIRNETVSMNMLRNNELNF